MKRMAATITGTVRIVSVDEGCTMYCTSSFSLSGGDEEGKRGSSTASICQAPPPQVPTRWSRTANNFRVDVTVRNDGGRTGRTSDEEADIPVPRLTSRGVYGVCISTFITSQP